MKGLLLILFLLPCALQAQQLTNETVQVELVNLYLTATDSKDKFITDLKPEDLIIKENGIKQQISVFQNVNESGQTTLGESDVPLTIAFLMDTSQSMVETIGGQQKFDIVRNAAFELLEALKPGDEAMLISFSDLAHEQHALTNDVKEIKRGLLFQEIEGGMTALLDAAYLAMTKLKDRPGRKIIVICSDGGDTSSKLRFDEVVSNLVASDIMVLAFGTSGFTANALRGRHVMEKLAKSTGGFAFFPSSLSTVDDVIRDLKMMMRSQYSIAYKPVTPVSAQGWREIEIQCTRKNARLRYRKGYYAN